MANPPIGNDILEGPLGVVEIEFDGVNLGKTTDTTEILPETDYADIIYQQDGTKAYDRIPTGTSYVCTCSIGQITLARLTALRRDITSSSGGSGKMTRDMYVSERENAKKLVITRVDSEGNASTDPKMKFTFYLAMCEITSALMYSSDTQRNLGLSFYIFYDEDEEAFGYFGYATSLGLTP